MDSAKLEELKKQGYRFDYGVAWPPLKAGKQVVPRPQWLIEKECYNGLYGVEKSPYYLGKEEHFKRFLSALFDVPGSIFPFQWNPNACRILHAVLNNNFTSVLGCAGSSKSYTLAAIGIGYFLLNPSKTKVIVTSTTVETAKGKIWGDMCLAWDQACRAVGGEQFLPGKKMAAHPVIRYELNGIISQKIGIELLPTTQSSEKASVEKLQGYKGMAGENDDSTVILIGDEWETLTPTIIQTARWNIGRRPNNRIIGAFNPTGRFTAGGLISKPKEGWESITMDDDEWETEDGVCIRFDAHKSPNLELKPGQTPWSGLITRSELDQMEERFGSKESPQYWSMVRAWFPPTGEATKIYSEAELTTEYFADHKVRVWISPPTKIAGLDPAFAHGGDGAILTIAQVGMASIDGKVMKVFEKLKTIELDLQMKKDGKYKDEQVVELTKAHLLKEGIASSNLAVDTTGAISFGSLIARDIGADYLSVQFGGAATELPAAPTDRRPSNEVYADLVSELWYAGKPLIRCQQIKGLDPDTMNEMCLRSYKMVGKKIQVEPKKDMKKRIGGRSPDRSDSLFVALFLARKRHGLSSTEKRKGKSQSHQAPARTPAEVALRTATSWGARTKARMADAAEGRETSVMGQGGWGSYFDGGGNGKFFGF